MLPKLCNPAIPFSEPDAVVCTEAHESLGEEDGRDDIFPQHERIILTEVVFFVGGYIDEVVYHVAMLLRDPFVASFGITGRDIITRN